MGYITPNRVNTPAVKKEFNKAIMHDIAVRLLNEESEDAEGVMRSEAEMVMRRMLNTAKYAKSDKDATSAAKVLLDYTYGRPAVVSDDKQEELPEIVFRVHPKDKKLLEEASARGDVETPTEEELESKIEVEIDGEDGTMRFD